MEEIKFRQRALLGKTHYWGFIDEVFVAPIKRKKSERFTGYFDNDGNEIYEGDLVEVSSYSIEQKDECKKNLGAFDSTLSSERLNEILWSERKTKEERDDINKQLDAMREMELYNDHIMTGRVRFGKFSTDEDNMCCGGDFVKGFYIECGGNVSSLAGWEYMYKLT